MNKELREKAIDAYLSQKEGFDWSGLMHYAQALLGSRDEVEMGINAPKLDDEKFNQAQKEGKKYLEVADSKSIPNSFVITVQRCLKTISAMEFSMIRPRLKP